MRLRSASVLMAIATATLLGGGAAYGDALRTRVWQSQPSHFTNNILRAIASPQTRADSESGQVPITAREQHTTETPPSGVRSGTRPLSEFSQEQLDYFLEVALGSEYGQSSALVRRWEQDIRIRINFPAAERTPPETQQQVRATVAQVVADLNQLLAESHRIFQAEKALAEPPIQIEIVDDPGAEANVEFYFVRAENFPIYDSNTQQGQVGFVWTWWNQDTIHHSKILVASNYLTAAERDHVIREEITQALGILKDSWNYPSSIFYQGWTAPTEYDPIDEAVIQLLYHPAIHSGMTAADVETVLNRL